MSSELTGNPFRDTPPGRSKIGLELGFFPLAFILFFCTPKVTINGNQQLLGWGHHTYEFPPGKYHIVVSFKYMFMEECGRNEVTFDLRAGEIRIVSFYMWPWIFARGQMSVR